MKKTILYTKWALATLLPTGAIVAMPFLTQQQLNKTQSNQTSNLDSQEVKESETKLIQSLSESTDNERQVNGIRVTKPIIGGPEELVVKQNQSATSFNPLDYGYYVYDGLDDQINDNLQVEGNVNLAQINTYSITLKAINKYKLKATRQVTIKVVSESDYNNNVSFNYSPYTINANAGITEQIDFKTGINTNWQLLVPVVVAKDQKIKIEVLNANTNDPNACEIEIMKLPASSAEAKEWNTQISKSDKKLPRFRNRGERNPYDTPGEPTPIELTKTSENIFTEPDSQFNYDAVYYIKTKVKYAENKPEYHFDQPKYKITILDKNNNNQISSLTSKNQTITYFVATDSKNTLREAEFFKRWSANGEGPAFIQNKAVAWALTKEDLQKVLYRGAQETQGDKKVWKWEKINPERIKEANDGANKMLQDYKKLAGIDNKVNVGKHNLYFNSPVFTFSFLSVDNGAGAVARNNIGIWHNNANFTINYNPENEEAENWLQGMWINNRDNKSKVADYLKHEFGHIFQPSTLSGRNFGEISNIFYFLYTDYNDLLEKTTKENPNKSKEEINKIIWTDKMRYFASFPETLENPLLGTYKDIVAKNPELMQNFFNRKKFWDYNDVKHTIFTKIFAKYGWEAQTYVWSKYRALQAGEIVVPSLNKNIRDFTNNSGNENTNDFDLYVYFLSEFAKRDLTPFFEHFGMKVSEPVKNSILNKGYLSVDMLNQQVNDSVKVDKEKKDDQLRTYVENGLSNFQEKQEQILNAGITINFKPEHANKLQGKIIRLIALGSKETNSKITILISKKIQGNQIQFENLNPGIYKVIIPDYYDGDNLMNSRTITVTLNNSEYELVMAEFEQINTNQSQNLTMIKAIEWEDKPWTSPEQQVADQKALAIKYAKTLITELEASPIINFQGALEYELFTLRTLKAKLEQLKVNDAHLFTKIDVLLAKGVK